MLQLRNYDLVRCDRDLIFEELLAVLLGLECLNISSLDVKEDATVLSDSVALALSRVHSEEVLGKVGRHHNFLTKYFDEVSEVAFVVLQRNFLEHEFNDLLLLIFFEHVDGKFYRGFPVPSQANYRVFFSYRVRLVLGLSFIPLQVDSPVLGTTHVAGVPLWLVILVPDVDLGFDGA